MPIVIVEFSAEEELEKVKVARTELEEDVPTFNRVFPALELFEKFIALSPVVSPALIVEKPAFD